MSWLTRLSNTFRPSKLRRDIEREMAFHLEERADELRARGLSEEEAGLRARQEFGNSSLLAERTRDMDVTGWLDTAFHYVRYSLRAIGRTPGFTATVVLTLALGIGANSAVFSALDAVLLRELPFPESERLVRLRQFRETETTVAPVRLEDWNRLSSTFEAITGYYVEDVSDTSGDLPVRVRRAVVAPRFLEVWGVSPAIGRGFDAADSSLDGRAAVVVSDRYWRERLGADPDPLSRTVRLEDRSYAVAGVMPPSFRFPDPDVDLWWRPNDDRFTENTPANRGLQWYMGVGRLAPGSTIQQARADLTLVQEELGDLYPDTDENIGVRVSSLKESLVGRARESLWLLFGAVTVLLLIACTNIAALFLARATRRERELALRLSLGASPRAVAIQLLIETGLLAVLGAVAGLLLAVVTSGIFRILAPELPRLDEVTVDGRVLLYTIACTGVVALLCGLVPAVRSARRAASLSRSNRTVTTPRHSLQWLLVGAQVTFSVTLLAIASLLFRSFEELSRVEPGFDATGVLALRVSGNWAETENRGRLLQRVVLMMDELAELPGVEAVASAWKLPGVPGGFEIEFELAEGRSEDEAPLFAEWRSVSPEYWRTMRIEVLAGNICRRRAFDDGYGSFEMLVNRRFVERYFPARSALGLHLVWEAERLTGRIVGVVEDARELGIDESPVPTVYTCDAAPNPFPWILARAKGNPLAVAPAIRAKVKQLEPLRSVFDIAPLTEQIGESYAQNRLRTVLLVFFAGTALALACLGVYGTLSYVVSFRRRELGLRLALGALRADIIREVSWQGLRIVLPAVALGLALTLGITHALTDMLFGVTPSDPLSLGSAIAVVTAVGALAALGPALRAARVEPMGVLRED